MSAAPPVARAALITLSTVLFILSAVTLEAQSDTALPRTGAPRVLGVSAPRDLSVDIPAEGRQRLARIIEDTLVAELAAQGFSVEPPGAAPVTLDTVYFQSGSRVTLILSATDSDSLALVAAGIYTGTADLALLTTVRTAVEDLSAQLAAAAEVTVDRPRSPTVLLGMTLLSPDEGVRILLSDNLPIGTIRDGRLELPFIPVAVGSTIIVEKRLDGYYPDRQTIVITDEYMTVDLDPLQPVVLWELSASWAPQRWAGAAAGVRRYLVPRRLFLQSTNQLSTRYRFSGGSRASAVFDTRLTLGGYLIAPDFTRIRVGLMTGGGFTFSALGAEDTVYLFVDSYLNLFSLVVRVQFESFAPFLQADVIRYSQISSGYLMPGTYPYFSIGAIFPWQP